MLNTLEYSDLTLGTAQLGMNYGIGNTTGKPNFTEAVAIIQQAIACGINSIDTARAYGNSEAIIGQALTGGFAEQIQVITKLDPLNNLKSTSHSENNIGLAVEQSILKSCEYLCTNSLQTLLLHKWEHRFAYQESIWHKLLELKDRGYIQKIGVSVYTPQEAIEALNESEIEHIQLPFNLLDWRWKASGIHNLISTKSISLFTLGVRYYKDY